jgi:hypothetical protein
MKQRSPVLGYNHNVRYAGRLWHVQTEDSGVNNPHVFTHLFHDGTILATKRLDYDPASEVSAVQKLMQTQHKAMLRELKAGQFDEKIAKFFGEPVQRGLDDESTDPNAQPPIAVDTRRDPPVEPQTRSQLHDDPQTDPHIQAARQRKPTPMPPANIGARPRSVTPAPQKPTTQQAPVRAASATNVPRVAASGIGGRRAASPTQPTHRPAAEGVVVSRPAVIIGGEGSAPRASGTQPQARAQSGTRWNTPTAPSQGGAAGDGQKPSTNENIFGGDLISEKSLDEVILAYLSEDLNEK